jgi:hypothetical protein
MDDGVRAELLQGADEPAVLEGEVHVDKADLLAGDRLPGPQPLSDGPDGGKRFDFELDVDAPAREVVDDQDVVALR